MSSTPLDACELLLFMDAHKGHYVNFASPGPSHSQTHTLGPLLRLLSLRPLLVALLLSAGGALDGCGSSTTLVSGLSGYSLPSSSAGCGGASVQPGGATGVPMGISKAGPPAPQVIETVNVCIGGKGPFPFIVDSGANVSTLLTKLAKQLGLPKVGGSQSYSGAGCTATGGSVQVAAWSVAGVPLASQTLATGSLPGFGGKGQPEGLLGSDVLSRFGAVRVDFSASLLLLPGPEGPAPTSSSSVTGPTQTPVPPDLLGGNQTGVAPMIVDSAPGGATLAAAAVRFGSHRPLAFAVDTGSGGSLVDSSKARELSLAGTDLEMRAQTVCSVVTVPLVHSGEWSVGDIGLGRQLLVSTGLGSLASAGLSGLLGSDQLSRFGWVVLDYAGGRLVLGRP